MSLNIHVGAVLKKLHLSHYVLTSPILSKIFMKTVKKEEELTEESATSALMCADPKPTGGSITNRLIKNKIYDLEVIVPVYNNEKYVEECLNSVISQKNEYRIKVIVIDDGSKDKSLELMKKYSENNVDIYTQLNNGVAAARNLALEKVDSAYIMFLDADDSLQSNAIATMLDEAYRLNADIVEGGFNRIKGKKKSLGIKHEWRSSAKYTELYGFPWGKVIKSNLFNNLKFPTGYWFEDSIMSYLVYPRAKKIVTISNIVYNYRYNSWGASAISLHNSRCIDTYWVTELMLKEIVSIKQNEQLLDLFMQQVILNFKRTQNTNEIIKKAIFIKTASLVKRFFLDQNPIECKKSLYNSLKMNDYEKYYMICSLL